MPWRGMVQGAGGGAAGWGSLPREQGCGSHWEHEGHRGCIPKPVSWDNRLHHLAIFAAQLLFLCSGREGEEESRSSLANGALVWVSRDLGCVFSRRLARGCARGFFLQQQELQLV